MEPNLHLVQTLQSPEPAPNLLDPAWVGARVLVVGLGESGLAMATWLGRCGAQVSVVDTREQASEKQALLSQVPQAQVVQSAFSDYALDQVDLLAWSPGVSIELGEGAKLYQRARDLNLSVLGELDLFLSAIKSQEAAHYRPKLIGVTGTNGKTTVTALCAHLCLAANCKAQAAGNIGPAMLDAWMQCLEAMPEQALPQVWVLELSSFQMALANLNAENKLFDVATVLNLSQDHLDWHLSMASYEAAKRKLLHASKVQVLASGDAWVSEQRVNFGPSAPTAIGDFGLIQEGPLLWLAAGTAGEELPSRRRAAPIVALINKRLMPAQALHIHGQHNQLNVLAALALCRAVGLPLHALLHGLRDYRGESHRCELISIIDGVEFIDDSKGTNVGATVAGVLGLAKPSHLILGGEGKGQDFSPLVAPVTQYAKSVMLIGRDAKLVGEALAKTGVEQVFCESLEQAVTLATQRATSGQAVLLSPACASFDMFKSYVHRGQVFQALVRQLAADKGQELEVTQ